MPVSSAPESPRFFLNQSEIRNPKSEIPRFYRPKSGGGGGL